MHRLLVWRIVSHTGVIWRGDSVIDGVPETLELLRKMVRCFAKQHWTETLARMQLV